MWRCARGSRASWRSMHRAARRSPFERDWRGHRLVDQRLERARLVVSRDHDRQAAEALSIARTIEYPCCAGASSLNSLLLHPRPSQVARQLARRLVLVRIAGSCVGSGAPSIALRALRAIAAAAHATSSGPRVAARVQRLAATARAVSRAAAENLKRIVGAQRSRPRALGLSRSSRAGGAGAIISAGISATAEPHTTGTAGSTRRNWSSAARGVERSDCARAIHSVWWALVGARGHVGGEEHDREQVDEDAAPARIARELVDQRRLARCRGTNADDAGPPLPAQRCGDAIAAASSGSSLETSIRGSMYTGNRPTDTIPIAPS